MSVSADQLHFGIVAFCGGAESCCDQYKGNIIADMEVLGLTPLWVWKIHSINQVSCFYL